MEKSQSKGLIILGSTNFTVFLLFLIPFIITKNYWFLVASLINIFALGFLVYIFLKLNKKEKYNGQK